MLAQFNNNSGKFILHQVYVSSVLKRFRYRELILSTRVDIKNQGIFQGF
jgi:hypothetical protein